jgi:UDP-glucose 4-epimerase
MDAQTQNHRRPIALVTGGAGFIGSHVVDELLTMGLEVVVLDDLSGGFRDNVDPRAEFIEGRIQDREPVKKLFAQYGFDYVFHLAAYAAESLSHFIKGFNYENNLLGSVNLINASINHGIKCFVFASSVAVYGRNQVPMHEEMTPAPEDSYGVAKWAVEQELRISQEMFGLNYVIFRPHNVYGERQNIGDKYRNVIGIFINQVMQGRPLTIFGDGEQRRAFSYIKEVAPVIARAVMLEQSYNQVFNLGADKSYTINEVARRVCQKMGIEGKIVHLEERNEVKEAFCSHDRVKEVFGSGQSYGLDEGLGRMVEWARRVGSRTSREFDDIEVRKNLPAGWG